MSTSESPQINLRITPESARRFVEELREDAEVLYENLQTDLVTTLAKYGIEIPESILARDIRLPSADELRKLLSDKPSALEVSVLTYDSGVYVLHPIIFCIFCLAART